MPKATRPVGEGFEETWKEGAKQRRYITLALLHMDSPQTKDVGENWPSCFLLHQLVLSIHWWERYLDSLATAE
jgi:hypothetical protein